MGTNRKKGNRPYITNSTANIFTTCQKKFDYQIEQGLRLKVSAPPLRFGTLFHQCQEAYWEGIKIEADVFDVKMMIAEAIESWKEKTIRDFKSLANQQEAEQAINGDKVNDIGPMVELVTDIMNRFVAKYYDSDMVRWEVLGIEVPFKLPLHTAKGTRSAWDFAGKIDLVLRDKNTGLIYIMEHKSMREANPEKYKRELPLKPQPKGYAWAVKQLFGACHGVIYNAARKKVPTEPKVLQKPNQGRKLSVAAQYTDTTTELFKEAIRLHDPDNEAAYEEILGRLKWRDASWLWRYELHIHERDIAEWEIDRWKVARGIGLAKSARSVGFMRSFDACYPFGGGSPCIYRSICLDRNPDPMALEDFVQGTPGEAPELDDNNEDDDEADGIDHIPFM